MIAATLPLANKPVPAPSEAVGAGASLLRNRSIDMRALVVGLVGAILSGSAIAACPIDRQAFALAQAHEDDASKITRPDLVGETVRGVRWAGSKRWNAVELRRGKERFVLRVDYTPRALPATMGFSWTGSKGQGINWNSKRDQDLLEQFEVVDGPLAGLFVKKSACE